MKLVCKNIALTLLFTSLCVIPALANAKTFEVYPGCDAPKAPKNIFYVDPLKGSKDGDGSAAKPWRTLQEVFQMDLVEAYKADGVTAHRANRAPVVKGGDAIYLRSGNHGAINLNNHFNKDFITVMAEPGQVPTMTELNGSGGKWVFSGITLIAPSSIKMYSDINKDIIFDSNTVMSGTDADKWTPEEWMSKGKNGPYIQASCATITNNLVKFVRHGITTNGNKVLVKNNVVDFFGDDGMRFIGDNTSLIGNKIMNHYGKLTDGNHNDAMQGWRLDGKPNSNLVIDSNLIMETTGEYAEIPPHLTKLTKQDHLQGITIFDGTWKNVHVTNNVVISASWHALSLSGLDGAIIANNSVTTSMPHYNTTTPWLSVAAAKNTSTSNIIVVNNISDSYRLPAGTVSKNNLNSHRTKGVQANKIYAVYEPENAKFDLRLKAGSPAIGAALKEFAPAVDAAGKHRGNVVDQGAFAYSAIVTTPTVPTPPTTPTKPTTPSSGTSAVSGTITIKANARQIGTPTLVLMIDGKAASSVAVKADVHKSQVGTYVLTFNSSAKPKTVTVALTGFLTTEQKSNSVGVFNVTYLTGAQKKGSEILMKSALPKVANGNAVIKPNGQVSLRTNNSGVTIDVSKL